MVKKIVWGVFLVVVLAGATVINYFAPVHVVGNVTGTEVKRVDISDGKPKGTHTKDVYFLYIEKPNGDVLALRNEDAWFYFKFNSADKHAEGNKYKDKGNVELSYYGWRAPLFSAFPNLLSIKETDSEKPGLNLGQYIMLGLYFLLMGWIALFVRKKIIR